MSTVIKTTFYNTPMLQKALKRRALESDQTISAYIQRAIADAIAEDLADIEAFEERAGGPTETYEELRAGLKRDGLI